MGVRKRADVLEFAEIELATNLFAIICFRTAPCSGSCPAGEPSYLTRPCYERTNLAESFEPNDPVDPFRVSEC